MDEAVLKRLEWIGTCLEKLIDINMVALGTVEGSQVELLDYIHNHKHTFLSELTEEELAAIKKEIWHD